jgi:hypothetical protein
VATPVTRKFHLPNGKEVPTAGLEDSYKLVGTHEGFHIKCKEADDRLVKNTKACMAMLAGMKMSPFWYLQATEVILRGVGGFYGRCRPVPDAVKQGVDCNLRRVLAAKGWRAHNGSNLQLYKSKQEGGQGLTSFTTVCDASLCSEMEKHLFIDQQTPAAVTARAALAQTAWALGCRTDPLSWDYTHVVGSLDWDWVMEAYMGMSHATRQTWTRDPQATHTDSCPLEAGRWPGFTTEPLWEQSGLGLPFNRRLAELGVVEINAFYTTSQSTTKEATWKQFQAYWEAADRDRHHWATVTRQLRELQVAAPPPQQARVVTTTEGPGETLICPSRQRWQVGAITAHRQGAKGLELRVSWAGWGQQHDSWEPKAHLRGFQEDIIRVTLQPKLRWGTSFTERLQGPGAGRREWQQAMSEDRQTVFREKGGLVLQQLGATLTQADGMAETTGASQNLEVGHEEEAVRVQQGNMDSLHMYLDGGVLQEGEWWQHSETEVCNQNQALDELKEEWVGQGEHVITPLGLGLLESGSEVPVVVKLFKVWRGFMEGATVSAKHGNSGEMITLVLSKDEQDITDLELTRKVLCDLGFETDTDIQTDTDTDVVFVRHSCKWVFV